MDPAHECLEPDDHVIIGPDDRLVVKFDLIVGQRVAQVLDQKTPFVLLILQAGRIEAVLATTGIFCGIEGEIGAAYQFVFLDTIIRRDRDAD